MKLDQGQAAAIRLGISSGFLQTRSTGAPFTFGEAVDGLAKCGLSRLEVWDEGVPLPAEGAELDGLAWQFQEAGITVTSVHAHARLPEGDDAQARRRYAEAFEVTCRKARSLGAGHVVVHPFLVGGEAIGDEWSLDDLKESVAFWRQLAHIAASYELVAAFENLPSTPGRRVPGKFLAEIEAIAEAASDTGTDDDAAAGDDAAASSENGADAGNGAAEGMQVRAGVCFDLSHSFASGRDPLQELSGASFERLTAIHVSDGIFQGGQDLHLMPGEGDLDWDGFFRLLKEKGFAGSLVLEIGGTAWDEGFLSRVREFAKAHGAV